MGSTYASPVRGGLPTLNFPTLRTAHECGFFYISAGSRPQDRTFWSISALTARRVQRLLASTKFPPPLLIPHGLL